MYNTIMVGSYYKDHKGKKQGKELKEWNVLNDKKTGVVAYIVDILHDVWSIDRV